MRITHVIPYFPPANCFGGVPEAVFSLACAQSKLGHEIHVLTTDAGLDQEINREGLTLQWKHTENLRAIGTMDGIHILYVPNRYPQMANRRKIFSAPFWNEASRQQLPATIDILHLHEVHIPGYRLLAHQLSERGARNCVSCHGSLVPPVHRGLRRILHGIFDPLLRKQWFTSASAYFALCEMEKMQLLQHGIPDNRIHILPHGSPKFDSTRIKIPVPYTENLEIPTFFYLGRFNRAKGILTLIQAYCSLVKKGYLARLVCCGPDEGCFNTIQSICVRHQIPLTREAILSQPGVYLLSELSPKFIPALFAIADCTICPSPYEIFGLVPIESLMCGVPIIATSSYGCLEHLPPSESMMRLVSPDDLRGLQIAMQDYPIRDKKNPILPESGSLLPSWDQVAEQVCDIYQQIARSEHA